MFESWYLKMNKYVPFLKFKQNEIMALRELSIDIKENIRPFFDFPRKNNMTELDFMQTADKMKKKFVRHNQDISSYYLDNYDIDEDLFINGDDSYRYLLNTFTSMIPVIGIDRSQNHVDAVLNAKQDTTIKSSVVAVRFTYEDFESFELVEDDIEEMLGDTIRLFEYVDLVFDCRYTGGIDIELTVKCIIDFIDSFSNKYPIDRVIVTGTSIPVPIGNLVGTESETILRRKELLISCGVKKFFPDIYTGDYTVVGADYSDTDIEPQLMMNVMTPKTVYSFDDCHFIIRGGALKTHPDGNRQFNEQARIIVSKPFYRGNSYSFGDNFIEEKSRNIGSAVMPGTILKPTINAHITYMMTDYTC